MEAERPSNKERRSYDSLIGWAVGGAILTGFGGLLFALIGGLFGDWSGAGISLVASAIAFGSLLNGLLRG